jgi:hypothetical protein
MEVAGKQGFRLAANNNESNDKESKMSDISRRSVLAVLTLLLTTALGAAETPVCGQPQSKYGDAGVEVRFIPAPLEHVRASVLRALPTLSARPTKEANGLIEAKIDSSLSGNAALADVRSTGVFTKGRFYIGTAPGKQAGVDGVILRIDSSGIGAYSTLMADEVVCLASLLSPVDPSSNPRGPTSVSPADKRAVSLPANTSFKVALRNFLYSKELQSNTADRKIGSGEPILEVIEDVLVDGVPVFRKGALVKARLTDVTAAGRAQRSGTLQLALMNATAVDGQEIAVTGGSQKEKGQYSAQAQTLRANQERSAYMTGGGAAGLMYSLLSKGYEAVIPAGTTFEAQVTQPATIEAATEPAKPAATSLTEIATSQQTGAVQGTSPSSPNLSGLWFWSRWGHLKLMQAAGDREVFGRAEGYDIDGVVNGTSAVLHYTFEGEVYYTVELDLKGDGNTISGQYWSGEVRTSSKSKPMEMSKVLDASLPATTEKPGVNVSGVWQSNDWGKIELTQPASQTEITGKARGYDLVGIVSGTRVFLRFLSAGVLSQSHALDYTAELIAAGDDTLSGRYASGELLGNSKTKPMELTRQK